MIADSFIVNYRYRIIKNEINPTLLFIFSILALSQGQPQSGNGSAQLQDWAALAAVQTPKTMRENPSH